MLVYSKSNDSLHYSCLNKLNFWNMSKLSTIKDIKELKPKEMFIKIQNYKAGISYYILRNFKETLNILWICIHSQEVSRPHSHLLRAVDDCTMLWFSSGSGVVTDNTALSRPDHIRLLPLLLPTASLPVPGELSAFSLLMSNNSSTLSKWTSEVFDKLLMWISAFSSICLFNHLISHS